MISMTHFFSVPAARPYNIFATGVLPVNDTFLTATFSHISRPTSLMFACVVTTLITPGGTPARVASYTQVVSTKYGEPASVYGHLDERERGERRLGGGLDDGGAARGEGRTEFAGDHRGREVPGREDGAAKYGPVSSNRRRRLSTTYTTPAYDVRCDFAREIRGTYQWVA